MYTHQDYPKWVYKSGEGMIVNSESEHEDATKDGWGNYSVKKEKPKAKAKAKSVDVEE